MTLRLSQKVRNWAIAVSAMAIAAIAVLVAITIGASFFTDVSHTTETIKELAKPTIGLIGVQ